MKLLIVVGCVLISSVLSAPQGDPLDDTPQGVLQEPSGFVTQGFNQQSSSRTSNQGFSSGGGGNGVTVVRYVYDFRGVDGYKFTYELSDGQIRSEEGAYKDGVDEQGQPAKILVVQGAYSFVAPDGDTYWTNYQADEKGYRPKHGKGVGGIKPGEDAGIDPNLLKSLVG